MLAPPKTATLVNQTESKGIVVLTDETSNLHCRVDEVNPPENVEFKWTVGGTDYDQTSNVTNSTEFTVTSVLSKTFQADENGGLVTCEVFWIEADGSRTSTHKVNSTLNVNCK